MIFRHVHSYTYVYRARNINNNIRRAQGMPPKRGGSPPLAAGWAGRTGGSKAWGWGAYVQSAPSRAAGQGQSAPKEGPSALPPCCPSQRPPRRMTQTAPKEELGTLSRAGG